MKVVDLMQELYEFRKPKAEPDGHVSLMSQKASGVIIGHEAFYELMRDPDSHRYIYSKPGQPFRFWCQDVPLYRSEDIDLDKFIIF